MSQRRTLILVAAIAIGALASFLVWNYVNGVQDNAYKDAERVPVFLVKQQISRGMTGTEAQAYIVKENIPRKFKPSNAIVNLEDISGKVALSNLVPNQVVVSDMFVDVSDPRAQQSFAERLTKIRGEDMVAVTVQMDKVRGVAGLVQPGDYVNMMVNTQTMAGAGNTSAGSNGGGTPVGSPYMKLLYQKVLVLAIDQSAVPEPGEATTPDATTTADGTSSAPATDSGLMTLIVPQRAAQWIATASASNALYLTLVARDYKPKPIEDISADEVYPASDSKQVTPYGPDGDKSAS